jgi:hypothetical protein
MVIGRWLIVRLLLPGYFHHQLFTAYQVLEMRFGRRHESGRVAHLSGRP